MELSPKVGRMCAMNVYLHGIGGDKVVIHNGHDSLAGIHNGPNQSAIREKAKPALCQRRRRHRKGRPSRRPRGFLDLNQGRGRRSAAARGSKAYVFMALQRKLLIVDPW
jgi:hypothetical protein